MLSTAKSSNVGFSHVVQLFAPATNPATHLAQKIPFINSEKKYSGCQQCAHKYYGLVGLGLVLGSVSFNWFVLVLSTTMWRHLLNQLLDGTSLVFATDPCGRNRSQRVKLITKHTHTIRKI